jgi:hypothetical protein
VYYFLFFFLCALADSAAAVAMGVYDGSGVLLVHLSELKTVTATLFGQEYTFDVAKDGSAVVLTRCATTSDKDARCEAFMYDRAYKIRVREEDSNIVSREIKDKHYEIEDSYSADRDPYGTTCRIQELEALVLRRGKYKKEISALQQKHDQKIKVTNRTCFEATELPLGRAVVIAHHRNVCMFLHRPPESAVSWGWNDTAVESIVYSAWETQKASLCSKNLPYTTFLADKQGLHSIATSAQFVFLSFPELSYVAQYLRSGELVKLIGNTGSVDEEKLVRPLGIAVCNGKLFVADHAKDRVCVYTVQTGALVQHLGSTATTPQPTNIAAYGDFLYVAAGKAGVRSYCHNFSMQQYVERKVLASRVRCLSCLEAEAVSVWANTVYVTYTGTNLIGEFGILGGAPLNMLQIHPETWLPAIHEEDRFPGIVVGPRCIYVVRSARGVVYVYDRVTRTFVTHLTIDGIGNRSSAPPRLISLVFDTHGCLLVTDAQASCVHKFDVDLILERYKTMENS